MAGSLIQVIEARVSNALAYESLALVKQHDPRDLADFGEYAIVDVMTRAVHNTHIELVPLALSIGVISKLDANNLGALVSTNQFSGDSR